MFQDLDIRYDNGFRAEAPAADSAALIYHGDAVLARKEDGILRLPRFGELSGAGRELGFRYAFRLGELDYFLADWEEIETPPHPSSGFREMPDAAFPRGGRLCKGEGYGLSPLE